MKRILILEKNCSILTLLVQYLKNKGYLIRVAQSIDRAENLLRKEQFDLLICERFLTDGETFELLERIKEKKLFMRTLVISEKKSLSDRLKALNLANDFLAKPFDFTELFLKIENLLNLEKIEDSGFIENMSFLLKDSFFQIDKRQFRPQELKILECFLKHRDLIVSYETITSYVWGYKEFLPLKKTISVYIRRIRSKLSLENYRIETIKNRGYRLVSVK